MFSELKNTAKHVEENVKARHVIETRTRRTVEVRHSDIEQNFKDHVNCPSLRVRDIFGVL